MRRVAAMLMVLAALSMSIPLAAWNDRGHMLVAFIAFRHLTPEVRTEVGRLLALNPHYASVWMRDVPANTSRAQRTLLAFQQASVWPDFIKGAPDYVADGPLGGNRPPPGPAASQNIGYSDRNQHRYWHFIATGVTQDGTATRTPPSVNAQSQIEVMRQALASPGTPDGVKSYDLVWLTHLVGDVHQPLHAVDRFTKADRDGDRGGGELRLECAPSLRCASNLHSQWDGLLGAAVSSSDIAAAATALDSGPPPDGAGNQHVGEWVRESVMLARTSAYTTSTGQPLPEPIAALTPEYIRRSRQIAGQRARLAGHRLAALINAALRPPVRR